ncbi:unnamed protein product [Rangifer tarandus platyrhynchus]|uniref:Uncharacterized protein n=1 Tax=Rangifer tarandus platyrhynchus TaxID=3082113 RepID=A0ABN9A8A5_RANTA|nr:unnamed protein product [Rangifer tarandus platyrhynchus]
MLRNTDFPKGRRPSPRGRCSPGETEGRARPPRPQGRRATPPDPPRGPETSAPGRGRGRGVVPSGPAAQTQTSAAARGPRRYQPRDAGPAERWPTAARSPYSCRRHPPTTSLPPISPEKEQSPPGAQTVPSSPPTAAAPPRTRVPGTFPRHRGQRDAPTGSVALSGRGTTEEVRERAGRPAGRRAVPGLGGRGEAPGDLAESRAKDRRRPAGQTGPGPATTGRADRSRAGGDRQASGPRPAAQPARRTGGPGLCGGARGQSWPPPEGKVLAGGTSVPRNPRPPNLEVYSRGVGRERDTAGDDDLGPGEGGVRVERRGRGGGRCGGGGRRGAAFWPEDPFHAAPHLLALLPLPERPPDPTAGRRADPVPARRDGPPDVSLPPSHPALLWWRKLASRRARPPRCYLTN